MSTMIMIVEFSSQQTLDVFAGTRGYIPINGSNVIAGHIRPHFIKLIPDPLKTLK